MFLTYCTLQYIITNHSNTKKLYPLKKLAKVKLAKPYMMYSGKVDSQESYVKAVGGKSLSTKMSKAIAQDIALDNTVCFINELILEQESSKQNEANTLFIPPFVPLYMLEIFWNYNQL